MISLKNRHTDLLETPVCLATILAATAPSKAFRRVSVVVSSARPITISVLDRTEEENTFLPFLHLLHGNYSDTNSSREDRDEQFPNSLYVSGNMACYKYCNVKRENNDWHYIHLLPMTSPTGRIWVKIKRHTLCLISIFLHIVQLHVDIPFARLGVFG